jgi:hypothetical protein
VARDQIRDQIRDRRRLSRPAPSQAEPRPEIRGTYCDDSGHLRRGRRVETQRSHLDRSGRSRKCHPPVPEVSHPSARLARTAASPRLRRLRSGDRGRSSCDSELGSGGSGHRSRCGTPSHRSWALDRPDSERPGSAMIRLCPLLLMPGRAHARSCTNSRVEDDPGRADCRVAGL